MKLLYPLAKRFIAGHDFDSAKSSIQKLIDDGYEVSIDYIGENNKNIKDCKEAFTQYLEIIKFFKNNKINISIKPTQMGMLIHPLISHNFIARLAEKAKENEQTIRLDMEDIKVTELTKNLAITLNNKYGNVGVAVQANLSRSKEDIDFLIDNNVSIRLVKGAYKGDVTNVLASFFSLTDYLKFKKANRPAIATHDEKILDKIDDDFYDYEFLYGIRRDLQKSLLEKQHCVRIYVPFGEKWLAYTFRRLKELKNLKFVVSSIIKEKFRSEG